MRKMKWKKRLLSQLFCLIQRSHSYIPDIFSVFVNPTHSILLSIISLITMQIKKTPHTHIRIYANNYACFQRSLILLIIIFLSDVHFALRNALHSHLTHSIHCDSRTTQMNRITSDMLWFFISSKHPKIYEMHAHSRFFFLYSHSEWLRF